MNIKITPEDKVFSQYIRMRAITRCGGCEYCGTKFYDKAKEDGSMFPAWKQLQNSHFKGRGKLSTRHDPDNCAGLCFTCHQYMGSNPDIHTEFFRVRLGSEKFEQLTIRAYTTKRMSKQDKKDLVVYYKQKIKELEQQR